MASIQDSQGGFDGPPGQDLSYEEDIAEAGEKQPLINNQGNKPKEEEMLIQKIGLVQLYALLLFLFTYLLNQLDRYMLAITVKPMTQELKFGDQACMLLSNVSEDTVGDVKCNGTNTKQCSAIMYGNASDPERACKWDYNGQGLEYQLVAGPAFIVIYTFAGIFISFAADKYNRKVMLAGCLIWWSAMTLITGFINKYWQLVILRFALGFGEAGCTPFVASMLTDIFPAELRGTALGVYNWGIYMGYSLSYALGNLITEANINGQGWRWSFFIAGVPGILLGILMLLSLKEPERKKSSTVAEETTEDAGKIQEEEPKGLKKLGMILKPFLSFSLIMAILAGSVRNAAGYVFAYNTQPYFTSIHQTKQQIAKFMGWIPIVGGSLSVIVGGFLSDRLVKGRGIYARVMVIIVSLLIAAPFAAGTLYFSPPWAYVCQIPTYLFGEMWIGITLAIVVEIVPSNIRTSAVAVYLFIISNVGGNMPLLVPPLQDAFYEHGYTKSESLRGALYILYPGLYVLGAILFIPAMFSMKRDQARMQQQEYVVMEDQNK